MSDNAFEKDYSDDSFWEKVKIRRRGRPRASAEDVLRRNRLGYPNVGENYHLWSAGIFHLTD